MTLKELRAALIAAQKEVETVTNVIESEKRSMNEDEINTFDTAMQKVDSLKRQVAAKEMLPGAEIATTSSKKVNEEFRLYLRGEARASTGQSNTTGADGKYLNPNEFSNELFREITSDNGILSVLRPMQVSSDKLDFPTVDDTTLGDSVDTSQSAELATITARKLAIANVEITLNQYAVETVVANQLRDDNAVNLEAVIAELGAAGIARNASSDCFTTIDAGITISDSAASGVIDYTDLVTLLGSVNGKYYENGSFVMSQSSFIGILGLLDTAKQPILKMAVEQGMKPTIFGKPVTIDDNAGTTIYFGDFSTVILAQNQNTSTLVDIYSLSSDLATKYVTSARMGCGVLSANAVHGLAPAA